MKFVVTLVSILVLLVQPAFAQIGYKALTSDRLDLKALKITKEEFFDFTAKTIKTNPLGLGPSTILHFKLCEFQIKGRALSEYKTLKGKEIAFLSNPSCKQVVLRKILVESYGFRQDRLSSYRNRQCLLDVTEIVGPIVNFFATQIEEPAKKDCPHCNSMAQSKAKTLFKAQGQINKTCGVEAGKTGKFVAEFSEIVEQAMREKVENLKK